MFTYRVVLISDGARSTLGVQFPPRGGGGTLARLSGWRSLALGIQLG